MTQIEVFVNEDLIGDHVGLLIRDSGFLEEEEGTLVPLVELTPADAIRLARAIEAKAKEARR